MRIGIAGIIQECSAFSPLLTSLADFRLYRGQAVLDYPGVRAAQQAIGFEPVPILIADYLAPSGPVERSAYLELRDEILRGLADAGKLDGVCLLCHGAMLVEDGGSGETDLVRAVRGVVGETALIGVRLDMHASLTDEFVRMADLWTAFRTVPHRDVEDTLNRAFSLLGRCIRARIRPRAAVARVPLLVPGEKAESDAEPLKSLLALAAEVEKRPGILLAEVLVGFAWQDAPQAGGSVVVIAEDEEYWPSARVVVECLAKAFWERREEFVVKQEFASSADEAIDRALRAPEECVFVSDSGDNMGAAAPGDGPHFLSRLLARRVPNALVAGITDEAAARACLEAGVGATVTVSLGGKTDTAHGDPVVVTGVVEHLYSPAQVSGESAIATLRVGGIRILVSERRRMFETLDGFRKAGVDPLQHKLVVVKLGYLWPELRRIAPREILAATPGWADLQLERLPYRCVNRPVFPLDRGFEWEPVVVRGGRMEGQVR